MSDSAADSFVTLPGSERAPLPAAEQAGPVDESQRIEVTLITRRRAALPRDLVEGPATLTREQLAEQHGTDPADIDFLRIVLAQYALQVTEADPGARRVKAEGSLAALADAFGAQLTMVRSPRPGPGRPLAEHRYRQGALRIPAPLNGIVLAVLGLDDRPQASPHFRRAPAAAASGAGGPGAAAPAAAPVSYTPPQVAGLYNFPAGTDGTGHTIAVIELGGGFGSSDLDPYFAGLGLAVPAVSAVGVDGAVNTPGQDPNGDDGEVLLDIEVAGAVAPGAAQVVYFAPNTDQGFVDAVSTAVHASPTPTVVSISWGQSEDSWTAQGRAALDEAMADAAALGSTVCVAAGDNGSGDAQTDGQPHTDFPASSPHALACGGTSLQADLAAGTISSETVWNDGVGHGATGGGVSDTFGLPSWQAPAGVPARAGAPAGTAPGRGVPDVAGCADPQTGYQVRVDGQSVVLGGTSAVAPLWAALTVRLAQATGQPFGLLQPLLYAGVTAGAAATGFQDITSGSNGAYAAGPGWDACTGLGSPDGGTLLGVLRG
ncbi:MAG TPA: S53 family peptidase [Streptosporangiaceae bacterium]|nr:S53 family peptidase [Streptosporangiaceae bacterium]